jgi:transposase InsO family protein
VADITFLPTLAGFLYLAVVLDAWSRRIVVCQRRRDFGPLRRSKSRPFCPLVGREGETTGRQSWSGLLGRAGGGFRWQ